MATSSSLLGGMNDLERELALYNAMQGRQLIVTASGTTYSSKIVRTGITDLIGQTLAQIGTLCVPVAPRIKAKTG
jgi:hypothetical protein